jgi:hypothetical protein
MMRFAGSLALLSLFLLAQASSALAKIPEPSQIAGDANGSFYNLVVIYSGANTQIFGYGHGSEIELNFVPGNKSTLVDGYGYGSKIHFELSKTADGLNVLQGYGFGSQLQVLSRKQGLAAAAQGYGNGSQINLMTETRGNATSIFGTGNGSNIKLILIRSGNDASLEGMANQNSVSLKITNAQQMSDEILAGLFEIFIFANTSNSRSPLLP